MIGNLRTSIVSCPAPYGSGGLGQHLAEVVEGLRQAHELAGYFCASAPAEDVASGIGWPVEDRILPWRLKYTPARFNPGRRAFLVFDRFDRRVASAMKQPAGTFYAFAGAARESFLRAKQLGCSNLVLIAASSHVNKGTAQYRKAHDRYPFESSWLNEAYRNKTLEEYQLADRIYVASRYTEQSFLERGIAASKLVYKPLTPKPRFAEAAKLRADRRPGDGVFRVVCVGSVTVGKGIPILIEAFARFDRMPAELILVGGSSSRGMRRYMEEALRKDPRIKIQPGDPLPHFLSADVCVHPSWDDGFGYAPMEALAVGVPVIVTEDTGMKDFVREGENGYIVPTGDVDALVERLEAVAAKAPFAIAREVASR
jgi:glycosyltransferase involved in cell wall biosynthesis